MEHRRIDDSPANTEAQVQHLERVFEADPQIIVNTPDQAAGWAVAGLSRGKVSRHQRAV